MYAPGISYHGDAYLAEGIGSAVSSFTDALRKIQEQKKLDAYNNTIVDHAFQAGRISPDEYHAFQTAGGPKRTGIAGGIAASIADDWKQKMQQSEIDLRNAEMQSAAGRAVAERTARDWQPSDEQRQAAYALGGDYVQTAPGHFQFQPYPDAHGGNFTPTTTTLKDPLTNKPFSVYSRGPNQVDLTPDSQPGNPMVGQPHYDPDSGEVDGTYRADGSVQYKAQVDPIKKAVADLVSGAEQKPASPQATFGDRVKNFLKNGPLSDATPVRIQTKQDYDALPSGTKFIAPDGTVRIRPPTQAASPDTSGTSGQKVRVISPQGVPGFIPADRLQDYLAAGYTSGPPGGYAPAATPVKVATPADAIALPPGTRYQTPDGKIYLR